MQRNGNERVQRQQRHDLLAVISFMRFEFLRFWCLCHIALLLHRFPVYVLQLILLPYALCLTLILVWPSLWQAACYIFEGAIFNGLSFLLLQWLSSVSKVCAAISNWHECFEYFRILLRQYLLANIIGVWIDFLIAVKFKDIPICNVFFFNWKIMFQRSYLVLISCVDLVKVLHICPNICF